MEKQFVLFVKSDLKVEEIKRELSSFPKELEKLSKEQLFLWSSGNSFAVLITSTMSSQKIHSILFNSKLRLSQLVILEIGPEWTTNLHSKEAGWLKNRLGPGKPI